MNAVATCAVPSSPGDDPRVAAEQTALLFERSNLANSLSAIVAVAVAAVLWGEVPPATLLGWLGYIIGVSAMRMGLTAAYRRADGHAADHGRWRLLFAIGAGANGLGWGGAAIALCTPHSTAHHVLVQVGVLGIMASGVVMLASSRMVVSAFLASASVPFMVSLLVCDMGASPMLAVMLAVFVCLMLAVAFRAERMIDNLLRLNFENADLAVRLALEKERADELNHALRASRDEALESVRAKSQFVANVSHEIRTPINGILGMSELLRATPLSDVQGRYVDAVHRSGCHLTDLVNDILDFSKMDAEKLDLEAAPFDVYALVEDVVEHFALRAHEKRIDLIGVLPPDLSGNFVGDSARLRQVISNLISNAIKFTERGQVLVRLSRVGVGNGAQRLCFEVSDTGIGIDAEARERVFDSFTQADGSTSRRFGGTGLGLTIVRRLVRLMGGDVEVDSEPGRGSTFRFEVELPQALGARPERDDATCALKVLVIEANPAVGLALCNSLSAYGIAHELAASRQEAERRYRAAHQRGEHFDAVFTNPHESCWSAGVDVHSVFADCPAPEPAVVVASRHAEEMDVESRRLSGAGACLSLPARRTRLTQVLRGLGAVDLPVAEEQHEGGAVPVTLTPSLGLGRVLVAEDNAVNQELVKAMLERLSVDSRLVPDGEDAVLAFEQRTFDIVLMDCQMPDMDGYEATARIRDIERRSGKLTRTPVIALTANVMAGDRERCLAAGMDDYLCKPFTLAQLHKVLMKWSPARRASAEGERSTDVGASAAG